MAKKEEENVNVLTNADKLREFKQVLVTITHYLQIIDDQKEAIKETVEEAAKNFAIDKRIIRKLANTMFKHNYADIQEENKHFEFLYEALIGGRLTAIDPTDLDADEEE